MKSKDKKKIEIQKEEILMTLPSFVNKLLLMMDSGLTLQDSFKRIACSYKELDSDEKNSFTLEIESIEENSSKTGENVIINFNKYGRLSGVKELARITNFLQDNQERGVDMWEKLEEMSESLWNERKRVVMEKIKLADTKISFPLGIMLMSMILLMTAPALMQI